MSELFNRYQRARGETTAGTATENYKAYEPKRYDFRYKSDFKEKEPIIERSIPYSERRSRSTQRYAPTNKYNTENVQSRYLGSPIRPLNGSMRKERPSLYKTLESDITDKYRVSKSKPKNNSLLSKLVNYFTHGEHDEEFTDLQHSARKALNMSPRKSTYRSRFDSDRDEVDDLIRHTKELEQRNELRKVKQLEKELKDAKNIIQEEREENEKLIKENEKLIKEMKESDKKLQSLERKSRHQEILIDELKNSLSKSDEEIDKIKHQAERKISNLLENHELELAKLKDAHQNGLDKIRKSDDSSANKIKQIEEENFNLKYELDQLKNDFKDQTQRINNLKAEMILKERLGIPKVPGKKLSALYIENAKIDSEISKLEQYTSLDQGKFRKQYTQTETNIEKMKSSLEHITKTMDFTDLNETDDFYHSLLDFLNDGKLHCEQKVRETDTTNYANLLREYYNWRRLNELLYNLLSSHETLKDCKILSEFSDKNIDLKDIYSKIKRESL